MPRKLGYRAGKRRYTTGKRRRTVPTRVVRMNVGLTNMAMGKEKKYFDYKQVDTGRAFQEIPVGGIILPQDADHTSLNLVGQGAGATQRDGRKILIMGIRVRGEIRFLSSANWSSGDSVRLMLIRDMQCNGTSPTPVSVLSGAGAGIATLAPTNDTGPRVTDLFMELANQNRYQILKDKTYTRNWTGLTSTETPMEALIPFKLSYKWKNGMPTNYNGSTDTPTISAINDNNLFILAIKNGLGGDSSGGAGDSVIDIAFASRLRYYDY